MQNNYLYILNENKDFEVYRFLNENEIRRKFKRKVKRGVKEVENIDIDAFLNNPKNHLNFIFSNKIDNRTLKFNVFSKDNKTNILFINEKNYFEIFEL